MERASEGHFGRASLRDEHIHRYELAARVARGFVVDCACGIGYGSEIIARQGLVETYLGIDPSQEAIEYASKHYANDQIYFQCGALEKNSCGSASIDTFLMFETLEHTKSPHPAIASIRGCLKQDGLLVGSVPSSEYETLCASTYGPNPFHLQRFSKEQIAEMLGQHFESVRLFSAEFILGTLVRCIDNRAEKINENGAEILLPATNGEFGVIGSIIFIAGSEERVEEAIKKIGALRKFLPSIPKVILDRDEVEPIRAAMQSMEIMIRDRDEVIAAQARMVEDRDEVIAAQARMVDERDTTIIERDTTIIERDTTIIEQQYLIKKLLTTMGAMRALLSAIKASLQDRIDRALGKNR
jgi:SAM-dependent methyltransferase